MFGALCPLPPPPASLPRPPPTLVTTSKRDDRVVPSHSFKFAARLQASQGCENPILIRIEDRAGHGAGTPKDKRIEQISDVYGFALSSMN